MPSGRRTGLTCPSGNSTSHCPVPGGARPTRAAYCRSVLRPVALGLARHAIDRIVDHFPGGLGSFEARGQGGLTGLEVLVHIEEVLDLVEEMPGQVAQFPDL